MKLTDGFMFLLTSVAITVSLFVGLALVVNSFNAAAFHPVVAFWPLGLA
jgi:hypothetical protein